MGNRGVITFETDTASLKRATINASLNQGVTTMPTTIAAPSGLAIRTNNVPRPVIDAYQLTLAERAEFDYLDWEAIDQGNDSATFFRFKGVLYDLSQFMYARKAYGFAAWDGYFSDCAFSGVLIRYVGNDDFENLIVGQYFS